MTELKLQMGHNNPPLPVAPSPEAVQDYLDEQTQRIRETKENLLALNIEPDHEIVDEAGAEAMTDYIKDINGCKKNFEKIRQSEKKPYLDLSRTVDGYFKEHVSPLDMAKAKAQKPLNAWLQIKAQEERKRREEEAKRLREEAEEKARIAREQEALDMKQEANQTMNKAVQDEQKAERYERSVQSGVGLAASRGQTGGVASIRSTWVGEITDIDKLDLEKLREFISRADLEKAVSRYVSNGHRNLRGASIFEKQETVVR